MDYKVILPEVGVSLASRELWLASAGAADADGIHSFIEIEVTKTKVSLFELAIEWRRNVNFCVQRISGEDEIHRSFVQQFRQ